MSSRKLVLRSFAIIALLFISTYALAADYAVTVYRGKYTDNKLGHVLVNKPIEFEDSYIGVVALARIFPFESDSHQWEVEGQYGRHTVSQHHWEFNVLAIYRWKRFPWNRYLRTTVAIGDGLSYASEIPPLELASHSNEGTNRLLNYMLVETTFAPPQAEDWSLVTRVHHRSGVYGLFSDTRGGSNLISVGLKFYF